MIRKLPIAYPIFIATGLFVGLVLAFKTYLMYRLYGDMNYYVFLKYAFTPVVNYGTWGLIMPVAYHYMKKYPIHLYETSMDIMKALCAGAIVALVLELSTYIAFYVPFILFGKEEMNQKMLNHIISNTPIGFISRYLEYWVVYGLFIAIESYKDNKNKQIQLAQMEGQLNNAKLSALKAQLQPHFLFNTLNTISSLMEIDVKKSQSMISKLGNLLRTLLNQNSQLDTTVENEITFIKSYLDIEEVRFQDRLKVIYDIDRYANKAKVPMLILQPLVENALKHGLANKLIDCKVAIKAEKLDDFLILTVEDNGSGSPYDQSKLLHMGIGLKNTNERLIQRYGNHDAFTLESRPNEYFKATIKIPYII